MTAEPRTEAGRRLIHDMLAADSRRWPGTPWDMRDRILAIEAEAAAGSRDDGLTVDRLARAIHESNIHMWHGDPEKQARLVIAALAITEGSKR